MGAATLTRLVNGNQTAPNMRWVGDGRNAGHRFELVTVTGPASYDAGGSVLNLDGMGFTSIIAVIFTPNQSKHMPTYVPASGGAPATGVVKMYNVNGDAESSGNLSSLSWKALIIGF